MALRRLFTGRGLALLAAAIACFVAANVLAAPVLGYVSLLFVLLVAFGLVSVFLTDARGDVTRAISTDLITVGETSEVHMHLRPRGRLIRHARWSDTLPPAVTGTAEGAVSPPDAPVDTRESIPLSYALRGIRRGVWKLGPLTLRTSDPFGLVNRRQRLGGQGTITVVPQLVPLPHLVTLYGAAGGASHTVSSRLGQGADNLAPRRYVAGDSMRRIHWRATAHRGVLMVRQEEEEASPDALVVLDLSPARWEHAGEGPDPRFELAVSACASAAIQLAADGYAVDVLDASGAQLGVLRGNEEDADELLVALATVDPRGKDAVPRFDGAPVGPLVVITGRIEDAADQLPRHPAAVTAVLLAAEPLPGALEALRATGWTAQRLDEVVSDA